MKTKTKNIKIISILLIQLLVWQSVSWALPNVAAPKLSIPSFATQLQIPVSSGVVEDYYKSPNQSKIIYLIQDPHTNESGQLNIFKMLKKIYESQKDMRFIFLEAGYGDESLSFLRDLTTYQDRERTAKAYIKKGKLQGPEYFDLMTNYKSTLWGVEDIDLYTQAWKAYKSVFENRETALEYLGKISTTIKTLKTTIYNRKLLAFDELVQSFNKESISLPKFAKHLSNYKTNINRHPNIKSLNQLSQAESRINFPKSNEELLSICNKYKGLCHGEKKVNQISGSSYQDKIGFFLKIEEALKADGVDFSKSYPELNRYGQYITSINDINMQNLLNEIELIQDDIYQTLQQNENQIKLHLIDKQVAYLKKLVQLKLSPKEYTQYSKIKSQMTIEKMTGFLNKTIMEEKKHYERALFLIDEFNQIVGSSEIFYDLTHRRDEAIYQNMIQKMDQTNQDAAVLVVGGFHADNFKRLLKTNKVSYVSLLPQVTHETNHPQYEQLLLQTPPEELFTPGAEATEVMFDNQYTSMQIPRVQTQMEFAKTLMGDKSIEVLEQLNLRSAKWMKLARKDELDQASSNGDAGARMGLQETNINRAWRTPKTPIGNVALSILYENDFLTEFVEASSLALTALKEESLALESDSASIIFEFMRYLYFTELFQTAYGGSFDVAFKAIHQKKEIILRMFEYYYKQRTFYGARAKTHSNFVRMIERRDLFKRAFLQMARLQISKGKDTVKIVVPGSSLGQEAYVWHWIARQAIQQNQDLNQLKVQIVGLEINPELVDEANRKLTIGPDINDALYGISPNANHEDIRIAMDVLSTTINQLIRVQREIQFVQSDITNTREFKRQLADVNIISFHYVLEHIESADRDRIISHLKKMLKDKQEFIIVTGEIDPDRFEFTSGEERIISPYSTRMTFKEPVAKEDYFLTRLKTGVLNEFIVSFDPRTDGAQLEIDDFEAVAEYVQKQIDRYAAEFKSLTSDMDRGFGQRHLEWSRKGLENLRRFHSEGRIFSFKSQVEAQKDYTFGFSHSGFIAVADELMELDFETRAELLIHLAIVEEAESHNSWQMREVIFRDNYEFDSTNRVTFANLRSYIDYEVGRRSVVHNGIDYEEQILRALPLDFNDSLIFVDRTYLSRPHDYGNATHIASDEIINWKNLGERDTDFVFFGDWQSVLGWGFANGRLRELSYGSEKTQAFKAVINRQAGVVGVWGVPDDFNQLIQSVMRDTNAAVIFDLGVLANIWQLYQLSYPHVDALLANMIFNRDPLLSYDEFLSIHKHWQGVISELQSNADDEDDYETSLEVRRVDGSMAWAIQRLPDEVLSGYIKRYVLDNALSVEEAAEFIIPLDERSDGSTYTSALDLAWQVYLVSNNNNTQNEYFRDVVLQVTDKLYQLDHLQYLVMHELVGEDAHVAHKAFDVLMRLNLKSQDFKDLVWLIQSSGHHSSSVAAYAYLRARFLGLKDESAGLEGRGGLYETNDDERKLAQALATHGQNVFSFVSGINEVRRSQGSGASQASFRVLNYAKVLDHNSAAPGELGRTWFTQLRNIAHSVRGYTKEFLVHIEGSLSFWLTGDKSILEQPRKNLLSAVHQSIEENHQGATIRYRNILTTLRNNLISDGVIQTNHPSQFMQNIRGLDEEEVIQRLPEVDEDYFERDIKKIEYMIRLYFALVEKFALTDKTIIPDIKGETNDPRDRGYLSEIMRDIFSFADGAYERLLDVIDQEDNPQAVFSAISDLRYSIHEYLIQHHPQQESADDEFYDSRRDNTIQIILDMDFNTKRLAKALVSRAVESSQDFSILDQINNVVSLSKDVYASGYGGSVFHQLLTELEFGVLRVSQVSDLARLLRMEVQKSMTRTNEELRFALSHFWGKDFDPSELTDEWHPHIEVEEYTRRYGDHEVEEDRLTISSIEAIENELVDSVIRDSNLLVLEAALGDLEKSLGARLSDNDDAWIRGEKRHIDPNDDIAPYFLKSDGNDLPRNQRLLSWWGKKALNLLRMTEENLPIPPFFAISAQLLTAKDVIDSDPFRNKVGEEITDLRQRAKYPDLKFLLYARSGSAFMLPGLLVTIPNLGMNDKEVEELVEASGDVWFAWDTYGEFIRSYAIHVLGIEEEKFQTVLDVYNKEDIDADGMKRAVEGYKEIVRHEGKVIPDDINHQALEAIKVVYDSWNSDEAREYRDIHNISQEWGTTVIMQQAGFGNLSDTESGEISGAGHAALRVLPNGRYTLFGRFRFRSLGEQLMTRADQNYILLSDGEKRDESNQTLQQLRPDLYNQVLSLILNIKDIFHYNPMIEFVIQRDEVIISQSDDDYITDQYPEFEEIKDDKPIAVGYPISGGALRGWVATNLDQAKVLQEKYDNEQPDGVDGVILFIHRVNPEIINRIPKEVHIVSKIMSVHARTLAQDRGISAISGVDSMSFNASDNTWTIGDQTISNGQIISIDGHENSMVYHTSGNIYLGSLPLKEPAGTRMADNLRAPSLLIPGQEEGPWETSDQVLGSEQYDIAVFLSEVDQAIGIEDDVRIALDDLILEFKRDGESEDTLLVYGLLDKKPVRINVKQIILDDRGKPKEATVSLSDLKMMLDIADSKRLDSFRAEEQPATIVLHVDSLTPSNVDLQEDVIRRITDEINKLDNHISVSLEGNKSNQELWLSQSDISSRLKKASNNQDDINYVHILGEDDAEISSFQAQKRHRWTILSNASLSGHTPIFAYGSIISYINGIASVNESDLENPVGTNIERAYQFYKTITQHKTITLQEFILIITDPRKAKQYAINPIIRIDIEKALRLYNLMAKQTARSA